jgi:hypothetical protein
VRPFADRQFLPLIREKSADPAVIAWQNLPGVALESSSFAAKTADFRRFRALRPRRTMA